MSRRWKNSRTLAALAVAALAFGGCARKIPKQGAQVTHEPSTVKFWGYKVTVLVAATPEELEGYITDADKLKQEVGGIKIERVSGERMTKIGDSSNYVIKVPGLPVPYRLTMIHYQPLQEIWYMSETANEFLVSVLRYQMKKVKDGTILTVRFELQEPQGPLLKQVSEQLNLQALMVKGTEQGTAMIQAYFDKSLTLDGLMKKGLRGEYYVSFFSAEKVGAFINAPPEKVHKYLTSPETWGKWEDSYKVYNMGQCLTSLASGACEAKINIMGAEYKLDFMSANYEPGKYTSCYFTSPVAGVGRVQTFLKPKAGGTDLSIEYMVQISQTAPAATELLVNLSQLPRTVEQIILDAKTSVESRI